MGAIPDPVENQQKLGRSGMSSRRRAVGIQHLRELKSIERGSACQRWPEIEIGEHAPAEP
jgi:hypothetical protein